mmetsp:Transcript_18764/g.51884  ORF Transcript_18764/g.51884 Transcript_18764/m.51884 type:complete len:304 (+) Transcript_18764:2240-3151(+)
MSEICRALGSVFVTCVSSRGTSPGHSPLGISMEPILARTWAAALPMSNSAAISAFAVHSRTSTRLWAGKASHLAFNSRLLFGSLDARPFLRSKPDNCRATTGFSAFANSWAKAVKYCSTLACSAARICDSACGRLSGTVVAKSKSVNDVIVHLVRNNEVRLSTSVAGGRSSSNHAAAAGRRRLGGAMGRGPARTDGGGRSRGGGASAWAPSRGRPCAGGGRSAGGGQLALASGAGACGCLGRCEAVEVGWSGGGGGRGRGRSVGVEVELWKEVKEGEAIRPKARKSKEGTPRAQIARAKNGAS